MLDRLPDIALGFGLGFFAACWLSYRTRKARERALASIFPAWRGSNR